MPNLEYLVEHEVVPVLKDIADSLKKLANPIYIITTDGKLTTFQPPIGEVCPECGADEAHFHRFSCSRPDKKKKRK